MKAALAGVALIVAGEVCQRTGVLGRAELLGEALKVADQRLGTRRMGIEDTAAVLHERRRKNVGRLGDGGEFATGLLHHHIRLGEDIAFGPRYGRLMGRIEECKDAGHVMPRR